MNLTMKLQESLIGEAPEFPQPSLFKSPAQQFLDQQLAGFAKYSSNPNERKYVGIPNASIEENKEYIEDIFNGKQYIDSDYDDKLDDGESIVSDFSVVISKNGAFLLELYRDVLKVVGDEEIVVFLEKNHKDQFTNSVLRVAYGSKVKSHIKALLKSDTLHERYNLTSTQVNYMMNAINKEVSMFDYFLNSFMLPFHAIGNIISDTVINTLEGVGDFFGKTLRIPESFWNPDIEDYTVGKLTNLMNKEMKQRVEKMKQYLPVLKTVGNPIFYYIVKGVLDISNYIIDFMQDLQEGFIAFVCGVWNAIMDLISGVFYLISLVFRVIKQINNGALTVAKVVADPNYYQSLMYEYLDNVVQALANVDIKEILSTLKSQMKDLKDFIFSVPSQIWSSLKHINSAQVAYYVGYIVVQIIEFIFPPLHLAKLGKIGNLGKLGKSLSFLDEITGLKRKKGGRTKIENDRSSLNYVFRFMESLTERLKKGTDSFVRWIKSLIQKIKRWIINKIDGLTDRLSLQRKQLTEGDKIRLKYRKNKLIKKKKLRISRTKELNEVRLAQAKRYQQKNIATSIIKIKTRSGKTLSSKKYIARAGQGKLKVPEGKFEDYTILNSHDVLNRYKALLSDDAYDELYQNAVDSERKIKNNYMNRLNDSEGIMLMQTDLNVIDIIANSKGKLSYKDLVISFEIESTFEPCVICKREIFLRQTEFDASFVIKSPPGVAGTKDLEKYIKNHS